MNVMAEAVNLYFPLWRPEEAGIVNAWQLIPLLKKGLEELRSDPERFKKLEPKNKYGTYDGFVSFVEKYLNACMEHPEYEVEADR